MKKLRPLTKKQTDVRLKNFPNWKTDKEQTKLMKTLSFDNFVSALAFCAKIAVHAEIMDHHPELNIKHNEVKITLTTNITKGLTKADFELAEKIDRLKAV